ncbi:MAG: hypothetical protein GX685_03385 [Clostridiales bacterium]|nr:hypothetical protein [Clostridiales bacterium]
MKHKHNCNGKLTRARAAGIVLTAFVGTLTLAGCGAAENGAGSSDASTAQSAASTTQSAAAAATSEQAVADKSESAEVMTSEPASAEASISRKMLIVRPLPETLDIDNLTDCTFAASFSPQDVYLDDDGALVVDLEVYDNELFDMVDISQLATGDTIVIDGDSVTVDTVERSDNGYVQINGGLDGNGYDLMTDDSGVYREKTWDDEDVFQLIGKTVLPVDQDFTFDDSSDLDNPARELYAGDFLEEMQNSEKDYACSPQACTVRVAGGKIVNITLVYVP